jgi:predicted class III extradiol MEMO1 family dioxygenase
MTAEHSFELYQTFLRYQGESGVWFVSVVLFVKSHTVVES